MTAHQSEPDTATWEAAVDVTAGIDRWCSGPDWVEPARRAFTPTSEPIVLGGNDGLAMLSLQGGGGRPLTIAGREQAWGFACPMLTATPDRLAETVIEQLAVLDWQHLVLPGFPPTGSLLQAFGTRLGRLAKPQAHWGIERQVARLDDGFDAWLARRPPKFRRNLRNATRRADEAALRFEDLDISALGHEGIYRRLVAVEERSWKGPGGVGINEGAAKNFYLGVFERLANEDRLRATVASIGDLDVGYIVGGIRDNRYRGLQLSYDQGQRHLSIGHLLQLREIELVDSLGVAAYDLGMDMPYKNRWADEAEPSIVLAVERPS